MSVEVETELDYRTIDSEYRAVEKELNALLRSEKPKRKRKANYTPRDARTIQTRAQRRGMLGGANADSYTDEQIVGFYKEILDGTRDRWPRGIWGDETDFKMQNPVGVRRFIACFDHAVRERRNLCREEVCQQCRTRLDAKNFLVDIKLFRAFRVLFIEDNFSLLSAYYDNFKEWELRRISYDTFADDEEIAEAARWYLKQEGWTRGKLQKANLTEVFTDDWKHLPLWYVTSMEEDPPFRFDNGLATLDLIKAAFPEYGWEDDNFKWYGEFLEGKHHFGARKPTFKGWR